MIQNRRAVQYGRTRSDGATRVYFDGKPSGWMMPGASQATLEASPGIQRWSHPRGKVSGELFDGGATIIKFSDYCKRNLLPNYPHTGGGR